MFAAGSHALSRSYPRNGRVLIPVAFPVRTRSSTTGAHEASYSSLSH